MNVVASSPEGLENCLADEIKQLGGAEIKVSKRFISFKCDYETFYRIHFFSRIAFRLYREVARFSCFNRESLYLGAQSALDWLKWLPTSRSFCVKVTGRNQNLRHSHFSALQIKNAIVDLQQSYLGERSDISLNNPFLVIHVHLNGDEAVLSLQSSLKSLHKRGYRPAMGKAPLKENLASGLIKITQWDGTRPLIDLMCGSGTFLIEGVSQVLGVPLRVDSHFLFENWIDFDIKEYQICKDRIKNSYVKSKRLCSVIGCEIDFDVYNQAKENVFRSGLKNYIDLQNKDFTALKNIKKHGIIICNPPYGKKIGKDLDLINLYTKIGIFLKDNFSGWEFWLLSGNPLFTKYLRMKSSVKIPVSNGGINCRWIKYLIR